MSFIFCFFNAVAAGFPTGQSPLASRLIEIEFAVSEGVDEIDVVIDRSLVLAHRWDNLYAELKAMKKACGNAHMKTILSVGELPTLTDVYIASMIAMYAGSDFIKTSTGKEAVNATLPVGIVMCRAIRNFYRQENKKVIKLLKYELLNFDIYSISIFLETTLIFNFFLLLKRISLLYRLVLNLLVASRPLGKLCNGWFWFKTNWDILG